ncbi:hypothetical protein Tco_1487249 [Tanacetum coccineum]
MLRRKVGEALRRKGCDNSFLCWNMLQRNPSGVLHHVIPFKRSLRDNLKPLNLNDDLNIWKALEKCHIQEDIRAAGGLDMQMKDSGNSFSVGQ